MAVEKPQLGAHTHYPEQYAPELLVSIPRAHGRDALVLPRILYGADFWTGYELSWLNTKGKPCVAVAEFRVSCQSPAIVESKSFKLYLNSLNQMPFDSQDALAATLRRDLSAGFGAPVEVALFSLDAYAQRGLQGFEGSCLDALDVPCSQYGIEPGLLQVTAGAAVSEALYSHLLKSNCPVTGQPDWASVFIRYRGQPIQKEGLLQYLVSFRQHQDFHENCVERIFSEILQHCAPDSLSVYARYTRRGGLDINPYRSTEATLPDVCRIARQ